MISPDIIAQSKKYSFVQMVAKQSIFQQNFSGFQK